MLLKRCNQCKKMYWRNVGPSGYCTSCHEKMRRATGASSPRTNAAIRSVDSPASRSDDWPHNHSRYELYDEKKLYSNQQINQFLQLNDCGSCLKKLTHV